MSACFPFPPPRPLFVHRPFAILGRLPRPPSVSELAGSYLIRISISRHWYRVTGRSGTLRRFSGGCFPLSAELILAVRSSAVRGGARRGEARSSADSPFPREKCCSLRVRAFERKPSRALGEALPSRRSATADEPPATTAKPLFLHCISIILHPCRELPPHREPHL